MAIVVKSFWKGPFVHRHWQDWADLVLGIVILASPWFLGMMEMQAAAMNAMIVGLAVVLISALALGWLRPWEEWINVALGLWLVASPWVFGYSQLTEPMAAHVILGLLVAVLAGSELWEERRAKPTNG